MSDEEKVTTEEPGVTEPKVKREPSFKVTRSPSLVNGFYAVTKGPKYLANSGEDEKRFIPVDEWTVEGVHTTLKASAWEALLAPQDFWQLPAFQRLADELPEAVNRALWRQFIFATPLLDQRGEEAAVIVFRKLFRQAVSEALTSSE